MAGYNNYNNNDAKKPFEPNVYSPYKFNNAESEIDKTQIAFDLWARQLKISIYSRKDNGDQIGFDRENGVTIYLNHTKAAILANEIRLFMKDPETYNGSGVNSGQGVITISNGKELGFNHPCIIIRKVDDTGSVLSSFAYEFKHSYYYSIRNYTGNTEFNKETASYNSIEMEEIVLLLDEYCKAMTYMTAYSVLDATKFNNEFIRNRLNSISEKLGIDIKGSGGSSKNYSNSSFFNNAGSNTSDISYPKGTIDDLD